MLSLKLYEYRYILSIRMRRLGCPLSSVPKTERTGETDALKSDWREMLCARAILVDFGAVDGDPADGVCRASSRDVTVPQAATIRV